MDAEEDGGEGVFCLINNVVDASTARFRVGIPNLAAWFLSTCILASCVSLEPFRDDPAASRHLLIAGASSFDCGYRTIITDRVIVREGYKRVNWGRNEGIHQLREQRVTPLNKLLAERFWMKVEELHVLSWTSADLPEPTVALSLEYRNERKCLKLPDMSAAPETVTTSARASLNYPRYEALSHLITELEKESAAVGL